MALIVDIGPGGRQLLKAGSGRPVLELDHKYIKDIFGDLIADVELEEQGGEIRRVKYSLVRHGQDVLAESSPVLGKTQCIGQRDLNLLHNAYDKLDRQRRDAPAQVRETLDSFYVPPRSEDDFSFRTYRDPVDGSKRLVILWGTLPGHYLDSAVVAPANKHEKEKTLITGLAGWQGRFMRNPWMKSVLWGLVVVICLVLLLLGLRPLVGEVDTDIAENDESGVVDDSEETPPQDKPANLLDRIKVLVFKTEDQPDTVLVVTGLTEERAGASEADDADESDPDTPDAPDAHEPPPTAGQQPGAEHPGDQAAGSADGGFPGGDGAEEDDQWPSRDASGTGGGTDNYLVFEGLDGRTIARVTTSNPPVIEYLSPESVNDEVWQAVVRTEAGATPAYPGKPLRTIWVPENEELLSQVEPADLVRAAVPSRKPGVVSDRSQVMFIRLTVDEQGKLVGQIKIPVNAWDE